MSIDTLVRFGIESKNEVVELEKSIAKKRMDNNICPKVILSTINTGLNPLEVANILNKTTGWIMKRNKLSGIIVKSSTNIFKLYINTDNMWICFYDDVIYEINSWEIVVSQIIKENQVPIVFIWTSETYNENIKLPKKLSEAIDEIISNKDTVSNLDENKHKKLATRELHERPLDKPKDNSDDFDFWICPICNEVNSLTNKYCNKCFDNKYYKELDTKNPLEEYSLVKKDYRLNSLYPDCNFVFKNSKYST